MVRDPRDVIVSSYFSHRHTHTTVGWPELTAHRARLETLSINDGLLAEIDFMGSVLGMLKDWNYSDPRVLEVRMERVTKDPEGMLRTIFEFLSISNRISKKHLRSIVDRYSFKNLSGGRAVGTENVHSHYRKGVSGDWSNYFTQEHIDVFKNRYADLLVKLGYEHDSHW